MRQKLKISFIAVTAAILCSSSAFAAVTTFTHTDVNPYSPRSGQSVGPYDAVNNGKVTMWYRQMPRY